MFYYKEQILREITTSNLSNKKITKNITEYSQAKSLAVFLFKMKCDKSENLHLPRKFESNGQAVVLECKGFYNNMRRVRDRTGHFAHFKLAKRYRILARIILWKLKKANLHMLTQSLLMRDVLHDFAENYAAKKSCRGHSASA